MEEFIINSKLYFYTDLIMAFCALLTSIVGFFLRKRHRSLKYMFLYPLASFLQIISFYFNFFHYKSNSMTAQNISILLFILVELFCILYFYLLVLKKQRLKKVTILITVAYCSYAIYYASNNGVFFESSPQFFLLQSFIILLFAIFHLIDLFRDIPKSRLIDEPSFWVTIGVLQYFLCTIPMYAMIEFIFNKDGFVKEPYLYSINYIGYSVFFLLIIRAYLCKAPVKP